jgi:hypothetical protein
MPPGLQKPLGRILPKQAQGKTGMASQGKFQFKTYFKGHRPCADKDSGI